MSQFSILVIHQPSITQSDQQGRSTTGAEEGPSVGAWPRLDGSSAFLITATIELLAGQLGAATTLLDRAPILVGVPPRAEPGELARIEATIRTMIGSDTAQTGPLAECASAVLWNGLGRYAEACAAAESASSQDDDGVLVVALGELIEAGVRSGKLGVAVDALRRLEDRQRGDDVQGWEAGSHARSCALLADASNAEVHHRDALDLLAGSKVEFQLARAHLVYGEWLRRQSRRVDARVQLRTAEEMFIDSGMSGFAERARREFAATGETVRKRNVESRYAADATGDPDRPAGGRWTDQRGDRRRAVHQPEDSGMASAQGVRQALRHFSSSAAPRAARPCAASA